MIHPTAVVSLEAELGTNVAVGPYTVIGDGVILGDGCTVGSHCVIGHDMPAGGDLLRVGPFAKIRSHSVIYNGSTIGDNFETGHHVTIRERTNIGHAIRIGSYSDVQGDCSIGDHSNLHSNVHVGKFSSIGAFCWIYPFVVLTNDRQPPSSDLQGVLVEDFTVLATHSVLLPGVRVGRASVVGAGSLVSKNVEPGCLVLGRPAKLSKRFDSEDAFYPWMSRYERLLPTCTPDEMLKRWKAAEE